MCFLICVLPSVEGLKARSGLLLLRPLKCLSCLYQIPPAHLLIICLPAFVRPSLFSISFSIHLFPSFSISLFLNFFYQISSAQVPTSSSYFCRPTLGSLSEKKPGSCGENSQTGGVWPKPTCWCLLTKLFWACQNDSEVLKHVLQKGGRWYLINFNT